MWDSIIGLVNEIKTTEKAGALTSAVAMSYVLIDTLTYLGLPAGQKRQGKKDFVDWVNVYLKAHEDQPYKYDGLDVYGARCAMLHVYAAEASFHEENPDTKVFGYHDGGKHMVSPDGDTRLVLIGTASYINDIVTAARSFLEHCKKDDCLRKRVESRLPGVLKSIDIRKLTE